MESYQGMGIASRPILGYILGYGANILLGYQEVHEYWDNQLLRIY